MEWSPWIKYEAPNKPDWLKALPLTTPCEIATELCPEGVASWADHRIDSWDWSKSDFLVESNSVITYFRVEKSALPKTKSFEDWL